MKIYLIERKDETDYDETNAIVVRATDKRQARSLAMAKHDEYGSMYPDHPGFRKDNLTISEVEPEGKAGVILVDFLRG